MLKLTPWAGWFRGFFYLIQEKGEREKDKGVV
jgi:hypothetical protein